MAINLTKGQNAKLENGTNLVRVGLSWDVNEGNGSAWDLDILAIELTSKDGKAVSDNHVVYYNSEFKTSDMKPTDPEHAVIHTGDNQTGDGEGDDESMIIDLSKLNSNVGAIMFVINVYDGKVRGQNFGQVKNAKARLYYGNNTVPELVYDLEEDYSSSICMEFCMLYKHDNVWKFKAIGEGNTNDLAAELSKWEVPTVGNA